MSFTLPRTMKAYRFKPPATRPVVEVVDLPSPAEDEVLLNVLAAGLCHTDLSLLEPGNMVNASATARAPFTVGHEGAGVVAAIGTAVPSAHPHLTLGTYVAIYSIKFCGMPTCSACSSGYTNVCRGGAYGLRHDGSWASYVVVAASCVVPVPARPEVIPPGVVSTATDAILSPYHAMKSAALRPEHTVLCVGIGGLGYNAVIIAKKHFGVRCVIACDTRPSSLDNAREAGADYAVLPAELAGLVAEKSLAIDFAFDFVGGQQTFEACFAALRVGGTIHILGIGNAPVSINPLVTMFKELKVKTSFYGTKEELVEVLQLIGDGVVVPRVETRRMSECSLVLDEMLEGKLKARIALIPDTDN